MKPLAILATIVVFALTSQAKAGALIENCTMKPNAAVKSMPSAGHQHVFRQVPQELAVNVYDQHGGQWAYVKSDDKEYPAVGWVLRSSLYKCENTKPWKTR